jgi:hypothetical protein
MPLTVAQIIDIAKISQYLSQVDVQKGSLFSPRVAPLTPQILYLERKAVEWMYNLDPGNSSLPQTSAYLYSLCRGYNLQAQQISGTAGSISPVQPAQIPNPYDFIVTGSSLIADGQSTVTLPAFTGFNVLFVRNGIPQSTIDTGASYFSWVKATGVFTVSPAAVLGEQFQIYPV